MLDYLKYLFHSTHYKGYGIHSPFVYTLVSDVAHNPFPYYGFDELEVFYKESKKRNKPGIKPKSAKRLLRLINSLNPTKVYVCKADNYDNEIFSLLKKPLNKLNTCEEVETGSMVYMGDFMPMGADGWNDLLEKDVSIVIKNPHKQNKALWLEITDNKKVTCTLQFYCFGVVFGKSKLPRRDFRVAC